MDISLNTSETQYHYHQEYQISLEESLPAVTTSPLSTILSQYHGDSKDVYGSITDLGITILSPSDSRAVHSVLGKTLKNTVVVKTREVFHYHSSHIQTALSLIRFVSQHHFNRIRCMILSELHPTSLSVPPGTRRLADAVTCPSQYQIVVQSLLGTWLIADSFEAATQIQQMKKCRWNCVTRDGIQFFANGEVRSETYSIKMMMT